MTKGNKFFLVIAGSRSCRNYATVRRESAAFIADLEHLIAGRQIVVISGTASGADTLGEEFAKENDYDVLRMPADWEGHGRAAGILRNIEMAKAADACIVFWDGKSRGARHMLDTAYKMKLPLKIYNTFSENYDRYFWREG